MNFDYVDLVLQSMEPVKEYLTTTDPCEVVSNDVKTSIPYRIEELDSPDDWMFS